MQVESRVRQLFEVAVDLSPRRRQEFLERQCAGDAKLYRRVSTMLEADLDAWPSGIFAGISLMARGLVGRPPGRRRPQRLGPWVVEDEIGRGGMGTVYRVRRSDGEVSVGAAKLMRGLEGEGGLRRFRRERRILSRLDHPNIPRLIDDGDSADGTPYLVMDLVPGAERIDRYCDRHRHTLEKRLALFFQVCDAVTEAHRKLIVHRDLKPSNILVGAPGEPKVIDFGIATILEPGRTITEHGTSMTPSYASPEAIRGAEVSPATDVFALGLLLHIFLSGSHPLKQPGASDLELLRMICEKEATVPSRVIAQMAPRDAAAVAIRRSLSPQGLRRRLEGDLDRIVAKALRKSPTDRYPSVKSLVADLNSRAGRGPR